MNRTSKAVTVVAPVVGRLRKRFSMARDLTAITENRRRHHPSRRPGQLLVALLACGAITPALAQTCAAPISWLDPGAPLTATTCGGEHMTESFCDGMYGNPGANYAVRLFLHPNRPAHIDITGDAPDFHPAMYLSDGAQGCDSAPCVAAGNSAIPIDLAGLPSTSYWLIVAASDTDAPNACGTFTLNADGQLDEDLIFANGFD